MLRWDCVWSGWSDEVCRDCGLLLSVFSVSRIFWSSTAPELLRGELVLTGGVVVGIDAPDAVDSGAGDEGICTGDAGDAGAAWEAAATGEAVIAAVSGPGGVAVAAAIVCVCMSIYGTMAP